MALEFSCQDRDRVEQLLADEGVVMVGIFRLEEGQYSGLETGNGEWRDEEHSICEGGGDVTWIRNFN